MAFATLTAAAYGCLATMSVRFTAGTLGTDMATFNTTVSLLLPEEDPGARTVGNWMVLLQATTTRFVAASTNDKPSIFEQLANLIYRFCLQATARAGQTPGITNPVATAILAAVNANLS